jgi:hypothetical protein
VSPRFAADANGLARALCSAVTQRIDKRIA